jgi:hypothetical protein
LHPVPPDADDNEPDLYDVTSIPTPETTDAAARASARTGSATTAEPAAVYAILAVRGVADDM